MLLLWFVLGVQLKRLHNGASKLDPSPHEREEKPPERRRSYALLGYFSQTLVKARAFQRGHWEGRGSEAGQAGKALPCANSILPLPAPHGSNLPFREQKKGKETRVDRGGPAPSQVSASLRPGVTANSELTGEACSFLPCSNEACSWDPFVEWEWSGSPAQSLDADIPKVWSFQENVSLPHCPAEYPGAWHPCFKILDLENCHTLQRHWGRENYRVPTGVRKYQHSMSPPGTSWGSPLWIS